MAERNAQRLSVAVDIGGTFTDWSPSTSAGRVYHAKSLTTPHDLSQGVWDCLHKAGIAPRDADELRPRLDHRHQHRDRAQRRPHGARRHPRDARRLQDRPQQPARGVQHLLPAAGASRAARADVRGERAPVRVRAKLLAALDRERGAGRRPRRARVRAEAVAVCFLHSYVDPAHEVEMGRVCCATRHAEPPTSRCRTRSCASTASTSARRRPSMNAYIGPQTSSYLADLERGCWSDGFAAGC